MSGVKKQEDEDRWDGRIDKDGDVITHQVMPANDGKSLVFNRTVNRETNDVINIYHYHLPNEPATTSILGYFSNRRSDGRRSESD